MSGANESNLPAIKRNVVNVVSDLSLFDSPRLRVRGDRFRREDGAGAPGSASPSQTQKRAVRHRERKPPGRRRAESDTQKRAVHHLLLNIHCHRRVALLALHRLINGTRGDDPLRVVRRPLLERGHLDHIPRLRRLNVTACSSTAAAMTATISFTSPITLATWLISWTVSPVVV